MHKKDNILFESNVHYDEQKKLWVATYIIDGKTVKHNFQVKPEWAKSIDKMNDILKRNHSPENLRKIHDNIERVSLNSFDKYKYRFSNKNLEEYLKTLKKNDLIDAKEIFVIKQRDEELSCVNGGSVPSSKCGTMWRLSLITKQINKRLRTLNLFPIPLLTDTKPHKTYASKTIDL